MRYSVLVLTFVIGSAASAGAQTCPPAPPKTGGTVWFESQVDSAARFIQEGALIPHPVESSTARKSNSSDFALVQFVVDTTGVPNVKSFRILAQPEGMIADSVTAAVARWRFHAAMASGCRVPQLIQTPIRWK
jgi:hypothetical protein